VRHFPAYLSIKYPLGRFLTVSTEKCAGTRAEKRQVPQKANSSNRGLVGSGKFGKQKFYTK